MAGHSLRTWQLVVVALLGSGLVGAAAVGGFLARGDPWPPGAIGEVRALGGVELVCDGDGKWLVLDPHYDGHNFGACRTRLIDHTEVPDPRVLVLLPDGRAAVSTCRQVHRWCVRNFQQRMPRADEEVSEQGDVKKANER